MVPFSSQSLEASKRSQREIAAAAERGHSATTDTASIHVLFIIDQLSVLGGAEQVLLKMVHLLPKHGVRCSIVTFKTNLKPDALDSRTCPLHVFPLKRTYDWQAFKVARELRRLIRSEHVDVVHTFFETSDIWGGLIAKLSRVPVLISSRRDMGILRTTKHRVAYRLMGQLFDQVQAVSEQVRQFSIAQDRLKPDQVVTLYNGTELPPADTGTGIDYLRTSLGFGGASHFVISVSNIRRVKGIDVLVRTAAIVCREFPHAMFIVVGKVLEHQFHEQVQKLTETLNVTDNIRFIGPRNDVQQLLKYCDVFCLLSRSEGFSNALLEAMACGLPSVVTDVGGNREALREGESGYLVPNEDAEAAAARIITLLEDSERARKMGLAGYRAVEQQFTTEGMISALMRRYNDLLRQRKR
jgi:glycosyltransferase involved in cell wall biosynthesis